MLYERPPLHQILPLNPSHYLTAFRPIVTAFRYLCPTWIIFCIGLSLPFSGCHCSNPTVEDEVPPTEILTSQPAPGGLPNIGGTCFIATATQLLAAVPAIRELIFHPKAPLNKDFLQELQAIVTRIIEGNPTTPEQMRAYCDVLSKEIPDQVTKQGNSYKLGDGFEVFTEIIHKLFPPAARSSFYWRKCTRSKEDAFNKDYLPQDQEDATLREMLFPDNLSDEEKDPPLQKLPQFIYFHVLPVSEPAYMIRNAFTFTLPATQTPSNKPQDYELVGFAYIGTGHAWAYVKREDNKWYKCNDNQVQAYTLKEIEKQTKSAQIYVYVIKH